MKPNKLSAASRQVGFLVLLVICLNCSKNNTAVNPPPVVTIEDTCVSCQFLYYGAGNKFAPSLAQGSYEAAARFTPAKIGNLIGKTIREIHYFIVGKPDSITVKLYGPLNDKTPGVLLYSADVTDSIQTDKWNIHTLTQPITLKNEDIWVSIEIKLKCTCSCSCSTSLKTLGADPGPAIPDGDWLYSTADNKWTPYDQRSGGASVNWNIRLGVVL